MRFSFKLQKERKKERQTSANRQEISGRKLKRQLLNGAREKIWRFFYVTHRSWRRKQNWTKLICVKLNFLIFPPLSVCAEQRRRKLCKCFPSTAHLNRCVYISHNVERFKRNVCGKCWQILSRDSSPVSRLPARNESEAIEISCSETQSTGQEETFTLSFFPFNLHVFSCGNQFWLKFP